MSKIVLPPLQGVGAGLTCVMPVIPQGETYDMIMLKLGGTTMTKALLENIKIKLGGKTIMEVTGTQLDSINSYLGHTANASYLPIWFKEPGARTITGEEIGGLDTSVGYTSFSMEIKVGAGALAPTIDSWALRSDPKDELNAAGRPNETKKMFRAFLNSQPPAPGAATYNLDLPLGSRTGTLLKRAHFFHTSLTNLEVKKDGVGIWESESIADDQFIQNELTRVTQAGHFCYDPIFRDNQSDAIPTIRDNGQTSVFEFKGTFSAADANFTAVTELYTTLDQI